MARWQRSNPEYDVQAIAERIRKLQALADSTRNDNVHQAAAAAAKIQELLMKYNLALSDIPPELKEASSYDQYDMALGASTQDWGWRKQLLHKVAIYNFCDIVILDNAKHQAAIIGKSHNIEVVLYLYGYLWREIKRLARAYGEQEQPAEKHWYAEFCNGAVSTIRKRLYDQQVQQKAETEASTALVVVTEKELEEEKFRRFGVLKRGGGPKSGYSEHYQAGGRAAHGLSLGTGREQLDD